MQEFRIIIPYKSGTIIMRHKSKNKETCQNEIATHFEIKNKDNIIVQNPDTDNFKLVMDKVHPGWDICDLE